MQITGLDSLVFGVDDIDNSLRFLRDYGLKDVERGAAGGRFEALDGTSVVVRSGTDAALAPAVAAGPNIREIGYAVGDAGTLERIGAELERDRPVRIDADGSIQALDESGFSLRFRLSEHKISGVEPLRENIPGVEAGRAVNQVVSRSDVDLTPRTLSHVVLFVPDLAAAEAFYVERLGFYVTDRFTEGGTFLRPAGSSDHHSLFLMQSPDPKLVGINHFAFHMASGSDVLLAGSRFTELGYQSFWGPGRHVMGSNWFWYFNSPLGGAIEYDADMDRHDASWRPRTLNASADNSQIFAFAYREKGFPGAH